jgi:choline dehydrogenase-like flavoprotein
MMDIEIIDCVVLGGGPAGNALASAVRRLHPRATVVVLEPARSQPEPGADPRPLASGSPETLLYASHRLGAEVREGTRSTAVRRVGKAALPVVTWEDDAGRKGRILADFVLDATELGHDLDELAVLAYLRGAAPGLVSDSQVSTSRASSACAAPAAR